jgi:EAL domain-containing protein (putative c-di-GMP-specific phosphodiesterase class I)
MMENEENLAIVRTIVALAQNLGMDVVAEGVETEEQRAFLEDAQCQNLQGHLIGRAGPIAQYAGLTGAEDNPSLPQIDTDGFHVKQTSRRR